MEVGPDELLREFVRSTLLGEKSAGGTLARAAALGAAALGVPLAGALASDLSGDTPISKMLDRAGPSLRASKSSSAERARTARDTSGPREPAAPKPTTGDYKVTDAHVKKLGAKIDSEGIGWARPALDRTKRELARAEKVGHALSRRDLASSGAPAGFLELLDKVHSLLKK